MEKKRGWIRKGMVVVSMTNLDQRMTVEEFIYKSGNIVDINSNNVIQKKFLVGIRCSWIDGNGDKTYSPFHSKELVPAEIAEKGLSQAFSFYSREGAYKDY
jgi:uncharacterized protein YodC (DUF2158 family)